MTPEQQARQQIDGMLAAAGWVIQDFAKMQPQAAPGVAVREYPLETGIADYLLFVNGRAAGVVEAKAAGVALGGISEQTRRYQAGVPANLPTVLRPLPFGYESTGAETQFCDLRDPEARSRGLFSFHRPEQLARWLEQRETFRARLRQLPALDAGKLRDCQVEAIHGIEGSLAHNRPRALVRMATGSGKTFMAVTLAYRLIKHAGARRILFLVDRGNLGRQALKEFQQYSTPDDGRKFTELYNVQLLTSPTIDPVSRVCISTIQRLYATLQGQELDPVADEQSAFETDEDKGPLPVAYNAAFPIELFDVVIVDECHRSIYNLWRQVLEYFDGFILGLTATPSLQTFGFFNQNLVADYGFEKSVTDGVNVDYEVYRINTRITAKGNTLPVGYQVGVVNKMTRQKQWLTLDEDLVYPSSQLDRAVTAPDQIRQVLRTFRDRVPTELFPGRQHVPKTLIFAKSDAHADDIVKILREEFGKGNDFCKKITYNTGQANPEDLIKEFRNSFLPRVAVTVDMIATGTDIKPLECLIFMRDVRSRQLFQQMRGRGCRTIDPTDLNKVTPDASAKDRYLIVDAVGVFDSEKIDSPMERHHGVSFADLVADVVAGQRGDDLLSSLAARVCRINARLQPNDRDRLPQACGITLPQVAQGLWNAIDIDDLNQLARTEFQTDDPLPEQVAVIARRRKEAACQPFLETKSRELLLRLAKISYLAIDETADTVTESEFSTAARDKARETVEDFERFLQENRDRITALQIFFSKPYGQRRLTVRQIQELAEAILAPPHQLTPERLWQAYARLEKSKVRQAPQPLLTDLISLVRFAIREAPLLEPFAETETQRF
jgi:type I restriction enzyme R subunit